ncbi:LysE family translocator [Celerinatantimonas sp. MCCC 1A17872]|uniref:LysE family translocator n=1 Tax=Celerinatantimonas sp. MCCC 1A17872 TaxID=3177514 RepID=UPI0038C3BA9A
MFGVENLWLFVLSGILLNMVPGPDSLLIAGRAAGQGFKAGSAAALGIGSGTLIHITAAALGLSAILATSATAFMVVKILGGIYLLYIAIGAFKASFQGQATSTKVFHAKSFKQVYWQGFITNLFNPKVAIFFLSFMPQFIAHSSPHKALAFLLLGLIFNFNGMLWCHFIAWSCSRAGQKLRVSPGVKKWLNRAVGGLFGFFGIKLLMATQR